MSSQYFLNYNEPHISNGRKLNAVERFEAFHQANPQVFVLLEDMTKELMARGRRKFGIQCLVEVLRWNHYMQTDDANSDFKINNDYCAHYARLLIDSHPEWVDVFQLRKLKAA